MADITRAETPPGSFYCDASVYAAARERVFRRSWQLVADSEAVKVPGQVHPFTLLEGCLDEPLLLTRDHADRVHCLSNVCTHRGTVLCPGAGHEKALVCRYPRAAV
jgi:choline monooxygenase